MVVWPFANAAVNGIGDNGRDKKQAQSESEGFRG